MRDAGLAVGISSPRHDARAKVMGREAYAVDHYPENLLWAGAKRAGIPHGRIISIHTDEALALPGVFAVLTGKDVPGTNRQGIIHKDHPVMPTDKVRHCGDPLALVLAEDRETLRKALELIRVDIEPLPGVFDPEEALLSEAPQVQESGNLLHHAVIETGKGLEGFEDCDVVLEETFEVPAQEHAFLETENGVAWQDPDGKLTMRVSSQAPFRDRFEISHALGLELSQIRVISPYLGGGFGGKDGATVQCLLAFAALRANGRPVKMVWEREESMQAGYKRHAVRMKYRLGAKEDGRLQALQCRLYFDAGPYAHLSAEVMALGMEHAGGPYRIPNALIEGWAVYTNNPIGGAFRGFGVCQVSFAFERMIDQLAAKLRMDPLDLRRKNALQRGDTNAVGVEVLTSTGMRSCLDALARHPMWLQREEWQKQSGAFKRRGVGVAAVYNAMGYGRGLPDSAIAKLELTPQGTFIVYNGVTDMGQGNAAAFVQMAGDLLCQEAEAFELVQPDTERTLPSGSSSAGRTTYTYGNALIRACRDMKEKLLHRACLALLLDEPRGLELQPGKVTHLPSGRELPLAILAGMLSEADRVCINQFLMPVVPNDPTEGKAFKLGFPHALFSYSAHLARVEVDTLTGKVEVLDYLAMTEGGRVLNPQCFEQQVQGGVAQGIGYALHEALLLDEGRILNPSFTNYIIPTALDLPELLSVAVEVDEPTGPFGMKGIGEVGMNGPLPAIANALEDAIGHNFTRSPLTPERVLRALAHQ